MTEKMTEMLTDDEMDMVVGGGSFAMMEYKQQADGIFKFKLTRFDGDEAAWSAFCSGTSLSKLKASISTWSGGVRGAQWDSLVAEQQKRYGEGLVIREMK